MITSLDGKLTGPCPLMCCLATRPSMMKPGESLAASYCTQAVFDSAQKNVRPGDAVHIRGIFEAEQAAPTAQSNDASACRTWTSGLRVLHVSLVEKWDTKVMGVFRYVRPRYTSPYDNKQGKGGGEVMGGGDWQVKEGETNTKAHLQGAPSPPRCSSEFAASYMPSLILQVAQDALVDRVMTY